MIRVTRERVYDFLEGHFFHAYLKSDIFDVPICAGGRVGDGNKGSSNVPIRADEVFFSLWVRVDQEYGDDDYIWV